METICRCLPLNRKFIETYHEILNDELLGNCLIKEEDKILFKKLKLISNFNNFNRFKKMIITLVSNKFLKKKINKIKTLNNLEIILNKNDKSLLYLLEIFKKVNRFNSVVEINTLYNEIKNNLMIV